MFAKVQMKKFTLSYTQKGKIGFHEMIRQVNCSTTMKEFSQPAVKEQLIKLLFRQAAKILNNFYA